LLGVKGHGSVAESVQEIVEKVRLVFNSSFISELIDTSFDKSRLKEATESLSIYELKIQELE
jgi:hypothetical protein